MATYRNTNPEEDLFEKVRRYISGLGLYAKPIYRIIIMATYKNTQGENILKGSEFKINVSMDPIDDYTMKDIIFKCTFFSGDKSITLDKDDMIFADDNNYVAPLDSSKLGLGTIKVKYEADIPDEDFPDGYRHEIAIINTGLNIVLPWAV